MTDQVARAGVLGASIPALATTRRLLRCGLVAGPLFVAVTAVDAIARPGFDLRRHGISLLSLGDIGWIQVANFVVAGLLSVSFAEGVRRALAGSPRGSGATAAPLLVLGYGVGLVSTGLFLVDPGFGFPPGVGAELSSATSWHGAVHAAAPPVAFLSIVGLTGLFARRYLAQRRRWRALWSAATGLATAGLIFWPGDGGSVRSAAAVFVASAWMTSVAADLLRAARTGGPQISRNSSSLRT